MEINEILSRQHIKYEDVKDIIENYNENNFSKILSNIYKFEENDIKIICKKIISNTKSKNIIERVCSEIINFIEFDFEYYKEIVKIILFKKLNGIWTDEIIDCLIENDSRTILEAFEDFGEEIPQNVIYDIQIIIRLLEKYNEIYFKELKLEKSKIIEICKRINYITIMNVKNILKMYYYFTINYELTLEECKSFLLTFFENYPSVCKQFLEENENYDSNTDFINYLQSKIQLYDKEENIKNQMKIFKPDSKRMIEYRKMQLKLNKKMNEEARKYSFLANSFKTNTILYGRRYGMAVATKNSRQVTIGKLQEFRYEYPLPLEYVLDPVEYIRKVNKLYTLGKEKMK